MRVSIHITLLAFSSLVAAQDDSSSPGIGAAPGEATVFATNGSGINRDELFAEPVVLGEDWTLTLKPKDDRGPGVWFVLLRSAKSSGHVLDLGTKFGLPAAGPSELLVDTRAFLADIDDGAHGGGGTTATLTVPVPYDRALVGMSWFAQALVLGDLPLQSGGLRTLGLEEGSGSLPWSEQGFSFLGTGYAGGVLTMQSYGGLFDSYSQVTLAREDGGTFDAVSLDVVSIYTSPYAYYSEIGVFSNLSGGVYESCCLLGPGTIALNGPEYVGITSLTLYVNALGDGGGLEAFLQTDNFVVDLGEPSGAGLLDPWLSSAVGGVVGSF